MELECQVYLASGCPRKTLDEKIKCGDDIEQFLDKAEVFSLVTVMTVVK